MKRIYIKGVKNKVMNIDRLALAYLMLARAQLEQEEATTKDENTDQSIENQS